MFESRKSSLRVACWGLFADVHGLFATGTTSLFSASSSTDVFTSSPSIILSFFNFFLLSTTAPDANADAAAPAAIADDDIYYIYDIYFS